MSSNNPALPATPEQMQRAREKLEAIKEDVKDRNLLTAARELHLIVRFKPKVAPNGKATGEVAVEIEAKTKVPSSKSGEVTMLIREGELVFNADEPEDPLQGTLNFTAEQAASERRKVE